MTKGIFYLIKMSIGLSEAHGVQGPVELPRDEVIYLELAKGIPSKRAEPSNIGLKNRQTHTHKKKDKNKTIRPSLSWCNSVHVKISF